MNVKNVSIIGVIALIGSLLNPHPKPYGDLDLLKDTCNVIWGVAIVYLAFEAIKVIHKSKAI